jgi:hypothetical protein
MDHILKEASTRNMYSYYTEKKRNSEKVPKKNYVTALYSCEESITPKGGDDTDFKLEYSIGAWNKESAKVTNNVRKL